MLNFYTISTNCDMVNDTLKSSTCRSKFRAPPLQGKMKVLPKTKLSPENRLIISDKKLKISRFGIREHHKGTTKSQRQQLKVEFVTRKKIKIKLREAFRLKLSNLLRDSK